MRKIVVAVPDDDCKNCRVATVWGNTWKRLACPFTAMDRDYEKAKPVKACREAEVSHDS